MPPKRNKLDDKEVGKNQQTLEKWLSPIAKKNEPEDSPEEPKEQKQQNRMENEDSESSSKKSSSPEHVKTRKQSIEKADKREAPPAKPKKSGKKESKTEKLESKEYKPERKPASRLKSSKKSGKRSRSPSEKDDSMEVEEPPKASTWKLQDPKYAFLFQQTVLSDTEYIFDKNDPASLVRYQKSPDAKDDDQQERTRNGESTKQPKKKSGKEPRKQPVQKEKNSSANIDDPE